MTADSVTGLAKAELTPLVQAEQVRLSVDQMWIIPFPHFCLDVCIAWTAWHAGAGISAWVWLGVMTACQVGRSVYVKHLARQARLTASEMLRRLSLSLMGLGAIHVWAIVMVFSRPVPDSQYILTMIMVGNAAGAISPAAGNLRSYLGWAAVFGGSLALAWFTRGTLEGAAIAILLIFLFAVLAFYVGAEGRNQAESVSLRESLRRERDRAERASEAKTRFFAAASHDLRQPLTALGYNAATVEFLAQRDGNETLARVGEGINRALTESRSLLASLLEVSELDAGAVKAEMSNFDLRSLIEQVGDAFAPLAAERGLELVCKHQSSAPVVALTDLALLRRVVNNLVGNALKFTDNGSITVEAAALVDARDRVCVRVTDTGPGIPLDAQERVFEEFYQIGNVERNRSRGLGLGLAIVRRLAVLLNAEVTLRSEPGRGSTFEVALPRGHEMAAMISRAPHAPAQWRRSGASRRILILDDESEIRKSLGMLMTEIGWVVSAAATHDDALKAWDSNFSPDALLLDFRLREGASGLDTLAALRTRGCEAPAILLTGDTEPRRVAAARAAGVPVMYKPVDGRELINAIETEIESARRSAEASS